MSYFDLNNFKKWIKNHEDSNLNSESVLVGINVESKFSSKKIVKHMSADEGCLQKMAKEFSENGGVVKESEGEELLVEVASGRFYVNKKYVTT